MMGDFPYRHIIWDWNGTLFDDAWLCVDVMNGMLARRGLPTLTPEHYATIFDFPVADYYRAVGFDFEREPFEQLSDEFIGAYYQRMHEAGLRAGTREVLEAARERGITQSVLSAMQHSSLMSMLDRFDLRGYFDAVNGLDDHHARGKVAIGRQWIATQTLDPARMVLVGDTTHDCEVAGALGVACWTIFSGHHAPDRLTACGARVIDSLADVLV